MDSSIAKPNWPGQIMSLGFPSGNGRLTRHSKTKPAHSRNSTKAAGSYSVGSQSAQRPSPHILGLQQRQLGRTLSAHKALKDQAHTFSDFNKGSWVVLCRPTKRSKTKPAHSRNSTKATGSYFVGPQSAQRPSPQWVPNEPAPNMGQTPKGKKPPARRSAGRHNQKTAGYVVFSG